MTRSSCYNLISKFAISCPKNNHGGSLSNSAETHILCFLWFAGNKCCARDVSERFNITISTCHAIVERVIDFLNQESCNHIKFPKTIMEKNMLAAEFEEITGFPNVIGCIDGTSIPIRTPAHKIKSTYVNRHDIPSLTLQGICD